MLRVTVNTEDAANSIPGMCERRVRQPEELQHSQQFVEKVDSAKVGEALVITGEKLISRRMAYSHAYLT